MKELLWLLASYLLGSLPSGYLITKISTGRNILEVGWKKTSGSNVFKNIGKWQGLMTGFLDIFKGYLAVWGAQKLGLGSETAVLAGVLAVIGHNWSCFLKFADGRGIGTCIGARWALAPGILAMDIVPSLLLALIWNASVATLLLLALTLGFSSSSGQFQTAGMLVILLLIPIFLKRLSPIKDLLPPRGKFDLLVNRLIFDNDAFRGDLRIKKLIKKTGWW